MSPVDVILLIVSIGVGVMSVVVHGWTVHGVGPAVLSIAGGLWQFWMQWLRHQCWLRHRDSGFAPGTQHLVISAAAGWLIGIVGAMIWLLVTR